MQSFEQEMVLLLRIAYRNVTLHWRHSLASLLSIMAAFFSLNVFQGYISDLEKLYLVSYRHRSMYGDLIVEHKQAMSPEGRAEPWNYSLTPAMQEAVNGFMRAHSNEIIGSTRFLQVQGTISNGRTSTIFITRAYDPVEGAKMRGDLWGWNALYGEPLQMHPEGAIHVGQRLGHNLGCDPVKKIRAITSSGGYEPVNRPFECQSSSMQVSVMTDSGQINALDLNVVGLVDAGYLELDRTFVGMSLKDAQTLLNTDRIGFQSLMVADPGQVKRIQDAFAEEVGSRFPELQAIRWQDHPRIGDLYNRTMDNLSIFRNFVVVVIISISALSVMNTMTKNLTERTREIGTLLSLGFRKPQIRLLFLTEALLLGLIGILMGGAASALIALIINKIGIFYKAGMLSEPVPFHISISPNAALFGATGLMLLAAVATYTATQRVLSKRIIECLQHI